MGLRVFFQYAACIRGLLLVPVCGCLVDSYNSRAAEQDMPRFFAARGITVSDVRCAMLPSSRNFTCTLTAAPDQIEKMRKTLKLREYSEHTSAFRSWDKAGCEAAASGRPGVLRLETSGSQNPEMLNHSYLILYYDTVRQQACIRSTYAYG